MHRIHVCTSRQGTHCKRKSKWSYLEEQMTCITLLADVHALHLLQLTTHQQQPQPPPLSSLSLACQPPLITNFLSDRKQQVKPGKPTFSTLTVSTEAPLPFVSTAPPDAMLHWPHPRWWQTDILQMAYWSNHSNLDLNMLQIMGFWDPQSCSARSRRKAQREEEVQPATGADAVLHNHSLVFFFFYQHQITSATLPTLQDLSICQETDRKI